MSSLPGHLTFGRANINGPVIGGYGCIASFGPFTIAASQTDLVQAAMRVPCDFRLERIAWSVRAQAVAGTLKFYKGASLGTLTTNLLAVASVDMGSGTGAKVGQNAPGTLNPQTGSLFETSTPTTDTLSTVAGVRDLAKGEYINIAGTTDATAGGAVDVHVFLYGFFAGHPNNLTEND